MTKFRLYFDKDKETAWLNEMAKKGYAMTGFFAGFYQFEACEPGEYIYQIDFSSKMFSVSDDYREFIILKMFKAVTILELICFMVEVLGAMNGASIGFFFMILIGAVTIAMMRATFQTKRLINELKERKGEPVPTGFASGKVSPVLAAGLLLNACAAALHNSTVSHSIVMVMQIAAIAIMLIGIYKSRDVFKN